VHARGRAKKDGIAAERVVLELKSRRLTDKMPQADAAVVESPSNCKTCFPKLLGRLRFRHLSLLVALDEHRNLHRAARAVHLAQPSATKLVHDLEAVLGFQLFDRLPTGMQPTEFGTVVLTFARDTLRDLRCFASHVDCRHARRDGNLVIGTAMGVATDAVVRAMAEIIQERPMLSVRLLADTSDDEIINRLVKGQINVAVGYFNDVSQNHDIECEVIGKESLYVVAREHHPLCRERPISLSGLERAGWIFPPLGSSLCRAIEQCLVRDGMQVPANFVESNSITATLSLLLTSDTVAMLPESVVRAHLSASLLVRLPVAIGDNSIGFGILSRRGEPMIQAAAQFSQLLRGYSKCFGPLVSRTQTLS
jgi:DNA-binding transcriptional LysR family regulator